MCVPTFQSLKKLRKVTCVTPGKAEIRPRNACERGPTLTGPTRRNLLPPPLNAKHQDVYTCMFDLLNETKAKIYKKIKDKMYTNQTGKLPSRSS